MSERPCRLAGSAASEQYENRISAIQFAKVAALIVFSLLSILGFESKTVMAQSNVDLIDRVDVSVVDGETLTFASGSAAKFSTVVNGRTHQQSPLTTFQGYQYITYYDAARRVCLGRRNLSKDKWEIIRFEDHKFETNDSHNTTVLGICENDGTIHLAFDHHATPLNYRVSEIGAAFDPESTPWQASLFGPVSHMLGSVAADPRVTYPRFFRTPDGNLMLYYRGVTSGNGNGMIEEYDGETHDWIPGLGKFIARDFGAFTAKGRISDFRCPYLNSISFAGDRLHASWVWRDRFKKTDVRNQHNLCYAYSDDKGRTWKSSAGLKIGETGVAPIHLNSKGLVVAPIPIDSGLTNQNTHYAFADGRIHVVMRRLVKGDAFSSYHHYWRDTEGNWRSEVLPFSGSRPKVVGSEDGKLILAYTDEDADDAEWLHLALGTPDDSGENWEWAKVELPQRQSIGGDAIIDLERWNRQQILSLYVQEQPERQIETKGSLPVDGLPSPLRVLDVKFAGRFDDDDVAEIRPPVGRLAIVIDGNSPDPDDIGATAVIFGLLEASKMQDRLVHLSHSCDLQPTKRISLEDELRRQEKLTSLCTEGVAYFGPFKNITTSFNCRQNQDAAVSDLRDAINASSKMDPLWVIEAGEPDLIGHALAAAMPEKRKFVHVVSHHPANDDSGDFFSWQKILDFGVQEHQIGDQNVGLQTKIDVWDWAKNDSREKVQWIWNQLAYAEQDGVVKFQTNKFDCSDAGMIYWWLTGANKGGEKHATPAELERLLR